METPRRDHCMPRPRTLLDLYLHLAKASEEQGRPLQQDKFLVLAASVAQKANWGRVAEECRRRVLKHNPNHILKRFPSMAEALESEDIRQYVRQLMRIYPFEKAEYLLDKFRASGYSGSHGYSLTIKPIGNASVGGDAKVGPAPSSPAGKPASYETPVNGNGPHTTVRPTLQKALAKPSVKATRKEPEPQLEPLPLEIPSASPQMSISYWTFFSWLIFALAFGIAVGGVAVFYFHPPG